MDGSDDEMIPAEPGPLATPEERLRYRAAAFLEEGLAFIDRHGDEFARLRTRLLLEARPLEEGLAAVQSACEEPDGPQPLGLARQGAAGLVGFAQANPPAPWLGSLEALIVLADLNALGSPGVGVIAQRLATLQSEDGGWGAPSDAAADRIFATGLTAGHLARTRVVRPEVLASAGTFMASVWSGDALNGRAWPALAAFGSWFSSVGDQDELADGALQQVGRELERGFRQGVYTAVETVRVLLHCDASAVPGAGLVPGELLEAILAEQGEDGGVAELVDGPDALRVMPTFDAMLGAIRLCGVI